MIFQLIYHRKILGTSLLHLILSKIPKEDLFQIMRSLAYAIYQEKQLTQENISYLNTLINLFSLEDEIEKIFNIDCRYELPFESILANMTQRGTRAFLLIFTITSKIFKDSNLEEYLKVKIEKFLPFDHNITKEITKLSSTFYTLTTDVYNNLFDIKNTSFFSSKSENNIQDYQKLFLITQNKVNTIDINEKQYFLKILIYLMLEDKKIDTVETQYIKLWCSVLNIDNTFDENIHSYNNLSVNDFNELKTPWFKKFLVFAFLLSQELVNEVNSSRLTQYIRLNTIEDEKFNELIKIVYKYKETNTSIIEKIHSNNLAVEDESNANYAQIGLTLAEIAVSYIPVIGPTLGNFNKIRKTTDILIQDRQSNIMNFGLIDMKKHINSDTIVICIDGFLSESGAEQFKDWMTGLKETHNNSWLKGYKWASNNFKTIIGGGVSSWYESVSNSEKAAVALANDIETIYSFKPEAKLILMGHSLGARVIYSTLNKLQQSNLKVYEVYLFGGAVSRTNKAGWLSALNSVEKKVYNYYSLNDSILKNLYRSTMAGDSPIGLGNIEFYNSSDFKISELKNIDVSSTINGHTEYKEKLHDLLNFSSDNI